MVKIVLESDLDSFLIFDLDFRRIEVHRVPCEPGFGVFGKLLHPSSSFKLEV